MGAHSLTLTRWQRARSAIVKWYWRKSGRHSATVTVKRLDRPPYGGNPAGMGW